MQIDIKKIFQKFQKNNPTPTTELIYSSNFELLVAVVLSAQATDKSVNKATVKLFIHYNTPVQIYNLGEKKLKTYIQSIGLFNTKARNIIALCKILIDKHNSEVPNTRLELEELPGVGRKTANVILNTAFGKPTIAVDTHIFRISNRLGIAKGKTPLAVEQQLENNIPKQFLLDAHHWLILHGRYICKARKPDCDSCFLTKHCGYYLEQQSLS